MKTDLKAKTEKALPKSKAAKGEGRSARKSAPSNGKHLATYEHAPIGIVEASLDSKYLNVNEEFCRIVQYQKEELLGHPLKDFTHEEDYAIDHKLHEQLVAGKIPFYRFEKRYRRKDGEDIWVELTRSIVRDPKGKPLYTIGVVLDISERKQVERVLRESVERLRLATEAAQMFTWEWDFQNKSYTLSDSFTQVLGFSTDLLSKNRFETLSRFIPADDLQATAEAFKRAVEGQKDLHSLQCRVIHPETGQTVWLEVSAKIVYDYAGQPERMFGVAQNITADKQKEEALSESEERFRALVSQATAGITQSDMNSALTFVNPRFCEMLGYSESELLGKTIWELTHTADLEENKFLFQRMLEQGESYQFEKRFLRKDGSTLWANASVSTIRDLAGKPKGGVGVIIDIEERKQAEATLTEYARQQESLYNLSDQLHRTASLEDVFNAALDAILNAVQCHRASILLYDDSNVMRFVAWRGLSNEYRQVTDGHSPWTPDVKHPEPICMDDVRTADLSESLRTVITEEGIGSLAFIPLVSNGKLIGKFMIYFNTPHKFSETEIELSLTIAHQLAFGVERKRAEEALRQSEERYRAVVESQVEMLCRFQPDGKILFLNGAYARARGSTPEELIQRNFWEFIREEDRSAVRSMLDSLTPEAPEVQIENRFQTADGERWTLWTNRGLRFDADGRLLEAQSSGIDVTARKRAENRLTLLAEISELIREMEDPRELLYAVSRAVGEHLQVKRALFNEIDVEHDREVVHRDYYNGVPSVTGVHKLSDYSSIASLEMQTGKTVVNVDSKLDPRTTQDYEKTYGPSRERAYIAIPLMRDSQWVASLWVSDDVPRTWSSEDVSLLETIAERTWTAVEKLRFAEQLRAKEAELEEIINHTPFMLTRCTRDLRYRFVSRAYAEMIGRTPEEVAGRPIVEIMGEEGMKSISPYVEQVLAGNLVEYETEVPFQGVGVRFLHVVYTPDRDEQGNVIGWFASIVDISERKRSEVALRESEQRYRFIVENTSDGIWWIELSEPMPISLPEDEQIDWYYKHAVIRQCNLGLARMYGYNSVEEVIGLPLQVVMPPENPLNLEMLRAFIRSGYRLVDSETREVNKEGQELVFLNNMIGIVEDGKLKGEWGTNRDITERKHAEEALRIENERFMRFVNSNIVGILIGNAHGEVILANDYYLQLLGVSRDDFVAGKVDWKKFTPPEWLPADEKAIRELNERGVSEPYEKEYMRSDGTRVPVYIADAILPGPKKEIAAFVLDITERKRAEDALRESEQRFRNMADHAPVMVWITDADGSCTYLSQSWYEFTGQTPETGLGYGWLDALHPEDRESNEQKFLSNSQKRYGFRLEYRLRRSDGVYRWAIDSAQPRLSESGEFLGYIGSVIDITDRKQAEEALRRNEQMFSTMINSAPFGVYFIDSEFRLRSINKGAEAVFRGIDPLIGRDFAEILRSIWKEPFATEAIERFRHTLRTGESFISPTVVEERANIAEIQAYDWQIHRITLADGTFGVVCYFYDLSEQKQMEAAVRASETLYRTIARSIPGAGVYVVDKDFRYLVAEGPVTEAFGLSREMLEGRTVAEVFPDVRGKRMEDRLRRNFAGETVDFETQFNGHVYWTQQAPLQDSIGQAIILTLDITERKRAEEALRQSEERFARFMQHLPGLAWIKDVEGRYVYANAAAEKAFNTSRDQLYGKTDDEIFPAEVAAQFKVNDQQALAEGRGVQVIETLEQADGVLHSSLVSKFPIPGPDGSPALIGGTAFDITERLQAEEALRESEERFKAILRQATAGIVRKDEQGRLIFVNQAFCNMLGYTESDLLGKTVWDFMHPDDIAENKASYHRLMKEGIPFKLERRLMREDGSIIWVDASVSPIMDARGKPQSAVAVEVDITGRKQAEEALHQLNLQLEERVLSRTAKLREVNQVLREEITERKRVEDALRQSEATARTNEEKLRTLFDLLPVGISFLDPQGQIIQMNSALPNILKLPKEQLFGQAYTSRKYIRADGMSMSLAEFASTRALAEGQTIYNVETGVVMEGGEVVWTNVSAAPVNVADVGAVVVTVDITDSKRAERALQESHRRLRILSQRLVEVQEDERRALARELHDRVGQTLAALNINLIIINSQLSPDSAEQIGPRLNDSMKLVAETIALVRDVMTDLRPSVLDDYGLEAALESHLAQFISRYDISAKFEKPAEALPRLGPSVEMTVLRIAQEALMNIARHAQATEVRLSLRRDADTICLTIQDNGIGIESWQDANRPGSHGLTIMRERAEAFDGKLQVRSVPGQGTIVEVTIPLKSAGPTASREKKDL